MSKTSVQVAFANMQPQNIPVSVVKEWKPENVTRSSGHVFFSVDGTYVSMKYEDYKEIFVI